MEDNRFRVPKLSLTTLLIVVSLGVIAATVLYQAKTNSLFNFSSFKNLPVVQTEKTTILNEENAVIDAVDKSASAVVAIGISQQVINPFDPYSLPTSQNSTIGTGFVVSNNQTMVAGGNVIIVTNKHVVSQTGGNYSVVTKEGIKYDIAKIYRDPILDLALVQVNAPNLIPVELGDSSKLKVGQTAIAIGNALGQFTNTVTTGVISGLGRKVVAGDPFSGSAESLDNLIQSDAAINPGNSGGPLLNSAGQVIGVNVATTQGAQNIGFAIPINSVKQIVDQFMLKGTISRPYLGVRYKFISRDLAILNNIPQGAYVQDIIPGSPAVKAGIQPQDIITKINGVAVDSETVISGIVAKSAIGADLNLTVWRNGKELQATAILEDSPAQ
ncbi:MAG: trypsin-like peptidase domain-containing protein [Candidatus Daviesbacteria bacterium]|nr:trypsin-like peptidase domain-containing protein [Candidatus Daviesbacteria bacterium]